MRIPRPAALAAALLAGVLTTSACSGGSDTSDGGDPTQLQQRLTTAKGALDEAETIDIDLSTSSLPDGITGLLSAKGQGNHSPAFTGTVKVVTGGASIGADVIATGGKVYAKTGFAPTFIAIDPASLKAPDPASLLSTDGGISEVLVETEALKDGGRSRDGKDVLRTIDGTLPGRVVTTIIPSADQDASFSVSYRLDEDDHVRDATLSGPFYPGGADVTYTVSIQTSDTAIDVTAP